LAEPGRGRKTATPIQVLGAHPDDGAEVSVLDGRYGPYIKHNRTFVTVPKDMDPAKVTLEQALPLIAAKAAKKKPAKKKAGTKKAATKKAGTKKTGAKAARKTTRKKKPAAEPVKTA
jgi:DNA topoisomerase-1